MPTPPKTDDRAPSLPEKVDPIYTTDASALGVPGVVVLLDPDVSTEMGVCDEKALTFAEAWASIDDTLGREVP